MKTILLVFFLLFGALHTLLADDDDLVGWMQSLVVSANPDILVIDLKYGMQLPADKLLKKITLKKDYVQTKTILLQQCINVTRQYGGNCFKVTFHDTASLNLFEKPTDKIRGEIYHLDSAEIAEIRARMESYTPPKSLKEIQKENYRAMRDTQEIVYDVNVVLQYGGESKFALFLPKFNVVRKHRLKFANPYYGAEIGPHLDILGPSHGSLSGIVGIEKSMFNIETSLGLFRTVTSYYSPEQVIGPFSQTLWSLKGGIGTEDVRVKVGRSFVLNEYVPQGQERIPFLDVGKINNKLWSFELQFTMNN